jgi:hypothetical protein
MQRINRVLPGNDEIKRGNVGISFAFKANLLKNKKYRFINNHAEDFLLINTMLKDKLKHRISDEVGYFVRDTAEKYPIKKHKIIKNPIKKHKIINKTTKKQIKKPMKKTNKHKTIKKTITKLNKNTIFIRTLFKERIRPN